MYVFIYLYTTSIPNEVINKSCISFMTTAVSVIPILASHSYPYSQPPLTMPPGPFSTIRRFRVCCVALAIFPQSSIVMPRAASCRCIHYPKQPVGPHPRADWPGGLCSNWISMPCRVRTCFSAVPRTFSLPYFRGAPDCTADVISSLVWTCYLPYCERALCCTADVFSSIRRVRFFGELKAFLLPWDVRARCDIASVLCIVIERMYFLLQVPWGYSLPYHGHALAISQVCAQA